MISSAPSVLRYGASLARPVEAMTRQPLSAKSEIAIEPTPPAAPVTSAGPEDGVRSWRSIAIRASIAVKPAVPIAIASARVSPVGSLTSQSPFTRALSA